ncbi:MAG: NAD-dependent deacetylase [Lachnospiraceae bacterium]|nr:NAD-dependent deacetylase [Lachnospiraceae bacterium]
MADQNGTIRRVREMVEESSHIVVLLGVGTVIESGGENLWSSRECYRLENLYHQSPDEMMSVGYYSARRDKFFTFYKKEILGCELKPAPLYKDLKRLQDTGKIRKIITQNYYGLHYQAGLANVVELHGNIHNNCCPHCGKKFPVEYIKEAKGVPLCDECRSAIRPGVLLFGEKIGNDLMTEAVNACESADLILVLGTNMYDNMVKFCTGNYKGERLVLITREEHYTDRYADYIIHDMVSNVLPKVIP